MTIKPFLKWPGRKFAILHQILPHLTPGDRLLEPFVGSGSVFLNSNYSKYVLADNNPDLINLYNILRKKGHYFITLAKSYITKNNMF